MALKDIEYQKTRVKERMGERVKNCNKQILEYINSQTFTGEEILGSFDYFGETADSLNKNSKTLRQHVFEVLSHIVNEREEGNEEVEAEDDDFDADW